MKKIIIYQALLTDDVQHKYVHFNDCDVKYS